MLYLRAFIAGLVLPSVLVPFILCAALAFKKPQFLQVPFFHVIPLLWGLWNVFYFAFLHRALPGNRDIKLLLTGGILGLIVAFIAVFWQHLPEKLGFSSRLHYMPLLIAPVAYSFLWRFVVDPLNRVLNLPDV
jgi:hypothetical protein